jgi:hypothetical protein
MVVVLFIAAPIKYGSTSTFHSSFDGCAAAGVHEPATIIATAVQEEYAYCFTVILLVPTGISPR